MDEVPFKTNKNPELHGRHAIHGGRSTQKMEALAHLVEEVLQRPNFRGVDGKEVHDCREDVKATMDIVAWLKNSFDQLFQPCQVFEV